MLKRANKINFQQRSFVFIVISYIKMDVVLQAPTLLLLSFLLSFYSSFLRPSMLNTHTTNSHSSEHTLRN